MTAEWFYSDGLGKSGPVSSSQLQALATSGQLLPADMVWKEGMAQWTPASKIKGLFPSLASGSNPPPIPAAVEPPLPYRDGIVETGAEVPGRSPAKRNRTEGDDGDEEAENACGKGIGTARWNAIQVVGGIIFILGLCGLMGAKLKDSDNAVAIGFLATVGGLLTFFVGRHLLQRTNKVDKAKAGEATSLEQLEWRVFAIVMLVTITAFTIYLLYRYKISRY